MAALATSGSVEAAIANSADVHALASLVRECATAGIGRRALLLRLSGLPPTLRRPQHLRLARAAIQPLLQADRARLFTLHGDDLAVIWRGEAAGAVATATASLARLFEDEELVSSACPWEMFSLPEHGDRLLRALRPQLPNPSRAALRPRHERLDIGALSALEAGLASVDVSRFVRRRRVCSLSPGGRFRLEWEQRLLSVSELGETLMPERSVQAEPWLYRRLTRTLDQRMLALLAAPLELRDAGPFSVALNVGSILSPGFLRFDAALPILLRGRVVLELLPADVLADLAAFVFARDFAHERGFQLLLRELNADLLPVFPLGRIGVDLLQLRWSEALAAEPVPALQDPANTVLIRADTPEAVEWGRAQGIGFFQGRMAEPA